MKSLSDKFLNAIFWVVIDKLGGSVGNFLITIILARLLMPEDFGLLAMVMVVVGITAGIVDSGFSLALIRAKEISELDKSTTFLFNLVAASVLYATLYFTAPLIADFFEQEGLVWILRVMGLTLIVDSFTLIQRALLTQQIDFKTQTAVRIPAIVASGGVGIVMAYYDWGVWSLVGQQLVRGVLTTAVLWRIFPLPVWNQFSWASFHRFFSFGFKILISTLVGKFYDEIYKLIIGKFFAAAILGFFTQANNFLMIVVNPLSSTILRVTYPVLAKLQDEPVALKNGYRKLIMMTSFGLLPVLTLMGIMAEPAVSLIFGDKWMPSVPFLQMLCAAAVTNHLQYINANAILVKGRSDYTLALEIADKIFITIAIVIGVQMGIYGLVGSVVVASYFNLFIYIYFANKVIDYSLWEQFGDFSASLGYSLLMGGAVYLLMKTVDFSDLMLLCIGGITGLALYLGLHFVTKTKESDYILSMLLPKLRQFLRKRKVEAERPAHK